MTLQHDMLHAEQNPLEVEGRLPYQFVTEKHSIYTLGADGRYSRFKTATGEQFPPADITVFMEVNDPHTEQHLLKGAQQTGAIFIGEFVGGDFKMLKDIAQYEGGSLVVVAEDSYTGGNGDPAIVRASLFPFEGGQVYEERREPNVTYRHTGSTVTKIIN